MLSVHDFDPTVVRDRVTDVVILDKARAIRRKEIEHRARSTICRVECREHDCVSLNSSKKLHARLPAAFGEESMSQRGRLAFRSPRRRSVDFSEHLDSFSEILEKK